jgi:acyl carrier protein
MNAIEQVTRQVLHEKFSIAYDTITLDTELKSDLGFDSLDAAELVMELENEFKMAISDDEADNIVTVGDIVYFFEKKSPVAVKLP